jgi:RHS repeat-associated protein
LDGYQYLNGKLKFFPTSEGYVNAYEGSGIMQQGSYLFNYVFSYSDHLGNIRLNYAKDPKTQTLKILEQNHYYPFGLKHENYSSERRIFVKDDLLVEAQQAVTMKIIGGGGGGEIVYGENKYKYNGKELQDELGLNWYDFGNRNYDASIGRFHNTDRFSEKYHSLTTYGYAGNNPILFNDIQGDSIGVGIELFNKFRNEVNNRKNSISNDRSSRINKALAKGKTDKALSLQARFARKDAQSGSDISILDSTLQELSSLESSSQVYNLYENSSSVPTTADGITTYDTGNDAVNISSKGGFSMGVFAHELKHAYQFETGALSFAGTGSSGGVLYDINDEYQAFQRGAFFGGLSLSQTEINAAYPNRQISNLNINTPNGLTTYGQQLKIKTFTNASRGTAQQNFYIYWKNDKK